VLAPRVRGSNPAAQRVEYRRCPECDVQMLRRNFRRSSGVIVDECREHGAWLDADELEQIAGFILSGGEASPLLDAPAASTPAERRARVDFARILAQSRAGAGVDGASTGSLLDVLTRLFS
jgi:Zn-finger nucleic acid-binding protein